MDNLNQLYVLAGPSGVGKGTVVAALKKKYPGLSVAISATTRPARPHEIDGLHYHFISEMEFSQLIKENGFLEWATVHQKHRYGTLAEPVRKELSKVHPVLLEIDLAGARQIKDKYPNAQFIFLMPPSKEELIKRLVGRGTEKEEEIQRRLKTAEVELAAVSEFEYVVLNDSVEKAAQELAEIIGIA